MEYKFPQLTTPKGLTRCSLAIYGYDDHSAFTCRKDPLCELGKKRFIQDININPSGVNFIVISKEKDKNSATVYDLGNFDTELFKLKTKKLGNPTAVLFTPDARRVILATSTGIHILDAKQFEEIDSFEIPFTPTEILLSNNGYYLVISDGKKVAVYNVEEHKLRKDWNFDIEVNDIAFNEDNTEFAILTADGVLNIYDTRNFIIKRTIDNLGDALACSYNFDGKYIAVATSPILITIIALSSLSTYLYSEYLVFGENIGFLIDVLTVTSWQLVIPLGVMGIWTLMSELRVYIIIFMLLASVVLHLVSDRKEDAR